MNLYNIFEGLNKNKTNEDFAGLMYGAANESNGLSGALADGNGISATLGTDNDISPIGSGADFEDDEHVTEDNPVEIDEVAMNPSAFAQAISSGAEKGVLVGFEFETLIPARTVSDWKNGPTESPAGYDPNSITWIEGKTTNDLLDGIHRSNPNAVKYDKVLDDLFKYKNSVQTAVGQKSIWSHYRRWVDVQVRQAMESSRNTDPVIEALKTLLKDREFKNLPVTWMDTSSERQYGVDAEGNPNGIKARDFVLKVLKDQTGVDFSGRVKKSDITPELIGKIKEAMQHCYRVTRNPVDSRCSQVTNAADGRRDELYGQYIPGWSYRQEQNAETMNRFKQHFAAFCTETMGTDNLKDLLKTKWAFKGRVNNTTDTLKEKLWYYVTPGAAEPASMAPRYGRNTTSYMDGAEFLKANLKDVYGDNMVIFRGYHQETKKLDRWYIEPDGSLRPNTGDYAAEVVSPPLKADAAMSALKIWYEKARTLNLYTNSSTGLHINVSIPDKIDVLKLAVFSGDQYVLKQFGREDNSYARSVIKSLKGQGNLPTLGSETFKNAEKQMKELVTRISGDHFATVNFNGKYVSFRHAGGNYLGKPEDIANTVGRFVRAMMIAADPSAYRDEYIGKLVKMMKPGEEPGDKLSLTDIRGIAERGIPIQYIDFVTTINGNPQDAIAAAERYVKENFSGGAGANSIIVQNDPSVRDRLLQDRGFSTPTKESIQASPDENFFRATIYPTTRRSLSGFADRFSTQGTDRGSAFGMYDSGHAKRAVGVRSMSVVKPTDAGYVDAVKALRGQASKPLPLPGAKAAPKAKATRFASQAQTTPAAQQDPSQAQQGAERPIIHDPSGRIPIPGPGAQQAQPSSDDESEPAGEERTYNLLGTDGDVLQHYSGTLSDTRRVAQSVADRVDDTVYIMDNGRHVETIRPAGSASGSDEESSGPGTWTLNNGEMVRHYDSTQVNSERAYELAREMYSQYGHPVTISNDGETHGSYNAHDAARDSQSMAAEYEFQDADGNVRARAEFRSDDSALQQAAEMASRRGQAIAVHMNDYLVGWGLPNGHVQRYNSDARPEANTGRDYIFRNPDNGNVVDRRTLPGDDEAMQHGQSLANRVGGTLAVVTNGVTIDTVDPEQLDESQDGSGITSPGGSTTNDSTSPIHGFDEDQDHPMSTASRDLLRVARQSNPEAMSDTDAIYGYMSSIAKKTQDNYKQVNNILNQLDPLSNELDQAERELSGVEQVNKTQQDLLRRLSHRVDQVRTQTLPSQKRAQNEPAQQAARGEKEREVISKKLDQPQPTVIKQPQQVVQPQPAGDVTDTKARQDIEAVNKQIHDLERKMYAKDTTDKAKAGIIRDLNSLKSTLGAANPDKIRDLARSLNISQPDQQELPFDEAMYESHLYAMKKAGYDIL